jgi:adenosine deaminase
MDQVIRFIKHMPKVELHVHLEGSIQYQTLLNLAKRHHITLPVNSIKGFRQWYKFKDFDHFIQVYLTISECLRDAEDIEQITQDFLVGQARQNIRYSEVTFTPYNQYINNHLSFPDQWEAINSARLWGERELGVRMGVIIDIPRQISPGEGEIIADWAIQSYGNGLVAFGLGGPEIGNPPGKFHRAFDRVRQAGIPCILHAGETVGPESIWEALNVADSNRIGHGVRAIEDSELMDYLRDNQIPLEVCLTSNICLNVYRSYKEHCLPLLLEKGLFVTINSDDPAMFATNLTNEYIVGYQTWNWQLDTIQNLVLNAIKGCLLPDADKMQLQIDFVSEFGQLLA